MSRTLTNWSGSMSFSPRHHQDPQTTDEIAALVHAARERGETLRVIGAAHSSTPLAATPDTVLSLEHFRGVLDHDPASKTLRVGAATRLHEVAEAAEERGLSLHNMGDIDLQTAAGAMATGTHGSGELLPNLSMMLVGGQLVTGTGEVIGFGVDADGDTDTDLLRAARVSLGALGVMTSVSLRLVDHYRLHRRDWCTHIDWAVEHFDELAASHRSFDMYWYPRSDLAKVRTLDTPGELDGPVPPGEMLHDEYLGPNRKVIPNRRMLRFEEMEYMLPRDAGLECFAELRQRIKDRQRKHVGWRVLVRTIAEDDTLLSNCYGRPTMTIALLHNAGEPYEEYFGDLEPILRSYGGRPHWGKKHTMRAATLRPLFPEWDTFTAIRRRLDPDGVFLNDHLRDLLEEH